MISATYARQGGRHTLEMRGHAGYAESGSDIVCSAASILALTAVSRIRSAGGADAAASVREGELLLSVPDSGAFIPSAAGERSVIRDGAQALTYPEAVFDFVMSGLLLLMQLYPDNISVDIRQDSTK